MKFKFVLFHIIPPPWKNLIDKIMRTMGSNYFKRKGDPSYTYVWGLTYFITCCGAIKPILIPLIPSRSIYNNNPLHYRSPLPRYAHNQVGIAQPFQGQNGSQALHPLPAVDVKSEGEGQKERGEARVVQMPRVEAALGTVARDVAGGKGLRCRTTGCAWESDR